MLRLCTGPTVVGTWLKKLTTTGWKPAPPMMPDPRACLIDVYTHEWNALQFSIIGSPTNKLSSGLPIEAGMPRVRWAPPSYNWSIGGSVMSNQIFSPEFKDEAVKQVPERGHPVTEVAARFGAVARPAGVLKGLDWRIRHTVRAGGCRGLGSAEPKGLKSTLSVLLKLFWNLQFPPIVSSL